MSQSSSVSTPTDTAAALGYRMPGEFEPVEAVWLTYPHNRETWPGCFDEACAQYEAFIAAAQRFTRVEVIGKSRDHDWPTNDSWIRDYGPIFVVKDRDADAQQPATRGDQSNANEPRDAERVANPAASPLACHDFTFNGWGGKYDGGGYQPAIDDDIPQHIAALLDIPMWSHDMVLEGGSIDVNGAGVVMTTRQCLRHENRNAHLSAEAIEQALHAALGTRRVVWLPGGIEGDDTDGHVDDVARFIAPDTVAAVRAAGDHPDHVMLEENWAALETSRDADGRPFHLIALPAPPPLFYDYPPTRTDPGGRASLPASHANFLILNAGVLVPTFGCSTDDDALRTLEKAMPDREIVGVRCEKLVVGFGAMHCLSMQQPRV